MSPLQLLLSCLSLALVAAAPRQGSVTDARYITRAQTPDDVQALVCSQIVNVLPYSTFRRQTFSTWSACRCTSSTRAVCEDDKVYLPPSQPMDMPKDDSNAVRSSPEYRELLRAFSVQQNCFLGLLMGRACAFSWEKGSEPACDCAMRLNLATGEQLIARNNNAVSPYYRELVPASTGLIDDEDQERRPLNYVPEEVHLRTRVR